MISNNTQHGFTIVELLVVIVVIGILAAVTIIGFNGVTNRARVAVMQTDLRNGVAALHISNVLLSAFPASLSSVNNGQGINASPGNSYTYNPSGDGSRYCLQVTGNGTSYVVTSSNTVSMLGYCSGTVAISGAPLPPNGGVVTFLAGQTTAGYADGNGASAQFNGPSGIAVDSSGTIYVADYNNNRIRKISSTGVVTTLAGSGTAGFLDATGTSAQFNKPYGLAVDTSGNVYVADSANNRIRKITSGGVVTTLAGQATAGYANGTGTAAKFNSPSGVAVDGSGVVYVADTSNFRVREITSGGVVTTLAGAGSQGHADGTGTAASFNFLRGVAVDTLGNVYIADYQGCIIRKITPAGVVTTLAGANVFGYLDATGSAAKFNYPTGVAVDNSGNVYVADSTNNRIRQVTSAGVVTTLAGSAAGYTEATGASAKFSNPYGIAVDTSGTIYVSDFANNRIREIK